MNTQDPASCRLSCLKNIACHYLQDASYVILRKITKIGFIASFIPVLSPENGAHKEELDD